jgi:hypothetical protein
MNKPDRQPTEKILSKLQGVLINIVVNNETLKQSGSVRNFREECREYNINPDMMTDAQKSEVKDTADILRAAAHGQDEFFSTIANKIVDRMMKDISIPFLNFTISNIETKTQGKEKGIKFDIPIFSTSIKPFVKFLFAFDRIGLKRSLLKINFQIDFDITLFDCKIMFDKNEKKFSGHFDAKLTVSITKLQTPFGSVVPDINLSEKKFDLELYDFILPVRT